MIDNDDEDEDEDDIIMRRLTCRNTNDADSSANRTPCLPCPENVDSMAMSLSRVHSTAFRSCVGAERSLCKRPVIILAPAETPSVEMCNGLFEGSRSNGTRDDSLLMARFLSERAADVYDDDDDDGGCGDGEGE